MVSVLDAFLVLHHSERANSSFSHTPCSLLNPKPIASGLLHKYFSEHYLAQDSGGIIYVPDTGAKPGEHHVLQGFKKKKVSYKKKKKKSRQTLKTQENKVFMAAKRSTSDQVALSLCN